MNLKKLEKATKILEQVKRIDKEIIELDKFAILVVNGEVESTLTITVKSKAESVSPESKNINDDIDQLRSGYVSIFSSMLDNMYNKPRESKTKNSHSISDDITETITLNVLAVLLADKYDKRNVLLNQIKSLGIEI